MLQLIERKPYVKNSLIKTREFDILDKKRILGLLEI